MPVAQFGHRHPDQIRNRDREHLDTRLVGARKSGETQGRRDMINQIERFSVNAVPVISCTTS